MPDTKMVIIRITLNLYYSRRVEFALFDYLA